MAEANEFLILRPGGATYTAPNGEELSKVTGANPGPIGVIARSTKLYGNGSNEKVFRFAVTIYRRLNAHTSGRRGVESFVVTIDPSLVTAEYDSLVTNGETRRASDDELEYRLFHDQMNLEKGGTVAGSGVYGNFDWDDWKVKSIASE